MDDATLPAGEFKACCLQLLDTVATSGEPLTIAVLEHRAIEFADHTQPVHVCPANCTVIRLTA